LSSYGSLKDLIYKTEPFQDYLKKYQNNGSCLLMEDIKDFGRQILKGIKGIIDCGFSFPNLCLFFIFFNFLSKASANVIMIRKDDSFLCKITDFEDVFVGIPSAYERYFYPRRKTVRKFF
jgi:hypothetical protein